MIRELLATLADALRYGDWRGHIRAWLSVALGEVRDTQRYGLAPDVEGQAHAIMQELSPKGLRALRGLMDFYAMYDDLPRAEVDAIRDVVHLALDHCAID